MTRFRPCIDLHAGSVKQIVGGTLSLPPASASSASCPSPQPPSQEEHQGNPLLTTNHVSPHPATYFAQLYKSHNVTGAHIIMLGPGNEDAARSAVEVWPGGEDGGRGGGFQVGGGLSAENVKEWICFDGEEGELKAGGGADKVIITSYLFPDAKFSQDRLDAVVRALGSDTRRLVIDLSCRRRQKQRRRKGEEKGMEKAGIDGEDEDDGWVVAMDKWQRWTDMEVNAESIRRLEPYCSEFLIHAADNEGLQRGIDEDLVRKLGEWCTIPVTYAGGGRTLADLDRVKELSGGKVDLTIGSALDIFGGTGVKFEDCVGWNRKQDELEKS